ncbi:MAG: alanine--tRNA ligase [Solirubrobacteraceae bacterium]|nr:alanine--tRNA ligase [Solirubrobacteraceae bacterium]
MTTDEIRETYLEFYASRDHKRLPSASLVPATFDPSVLLTTAGMHPLKPYFLGQETPPHHRLTSCQKCFRTTDIENVGNTARHLTFFEMLGNFSMGDYFKQGAAEFAWELSLQGFGFKPEQIWVTVFEGDEELGLGPDQEAIDAWLEIGVPRERIVACNREENFWQAGPTGPCGPCSELYLDRGVEFGKEDDLPGEENERFLEYWNLVFMQFNQDPVNTLKPLPAQNIDTGLGLNRMALIQQNAPTIFETDHFIPLIDLGRELAQKEVDERALRILADHSRAATFLIADGVVPSNEDRGYILRRIMRRAIQQGHRIGIEGDEGLFLPLFVDRVIEVMGKGYPEIVKERENIQRWVKAEEEGFGRTLEQGTKLLEEVIERSRETGAIPAADAFKLHDTFGFPFEVTRELALEEGLEVDTLGFDELMEQQRALSRGGRAQAVDGEGLREKAQAIIRGSDFETQFVGYETTEQHTAVGAIEEVGGQLLVRLVESPFYATGGGQVADAGELACDGGDCRATVTDVLRIGNDQALVVEVVEGELKDGERVTARVDRAARHATQANHTATHLLHAALRDTLGPHVRQAGSYVGPDKLRFDFTHGDKLSEDEFRAVEDQINAWILRNDPVRPQTTTLAAAQELGAMALFGEKYGEVVRMVEIGDGEYSRELCGGTHVRSTAEIGVFKITSEGSSAANVRRIEAITGPEAVKLLREEDRLLRESASALKTQTERVPEAIVALQQKAKEAAKAKAAGGGADEAALAGKAADVAGASVVAETVEGIEPKQLMDVADRVKGKLGDNGAVVLGAVNDGKVSLVVAVSPALVERGVKAGAIVKEAAQVVGGGGGGRDTIAQAGGKDPEKLPDALTAAKAAIERALS